MSVLHFVCGVALVLAFTWGAVFGYRARKAECGVEHPAGCARVVDPCRNVVGDPRVAPVSCSAGAELTVDERTGLAFCVCPPGSWP